MDPILWTTRDADWDAERLAGTLTDLRKYTGRQLSDYCAHRGPECFLETLRAQALADRERRFWQPSRHPEAVAVEEGASTGSGTCRGGRGTWFTGRL